MLRRAVQLQDKWMTRAVEITASRSNAMSAVPSLTRRGAKRFKAIPVW
jgi:hypothetical protein